MDPDGHSPVSFIDQEGTGQAITNTLVRHLAAVGRGTNRSALRRAEASAEDRFAHHRAGNTSSTRSGGVAAWAPPSYQTWLAWDPDRQVTEARANGAAARALVEARTFDLANPAVVYLADLHQVLTDRAAAIDHPILVSTTLNGVARGRRAVTRRPGTLPATGSTTRPRPIRGRQERDRGGEPGRTDGQSHGGPGGDDGHSSMVLPA